MLPSAASRLTILLGALSAIGPLSMDIYLVSMPSMTDTFGTTVDRVQLTLSIYMLGFGISQLVYGPLSDRFGRRPILIAGLAIHMVASIGAAMADSITALIVSRFFQAIGTCAGIVVTRAVVRDLYTREGAAKVLSYMPLVIGIAPMAAPMIGSHLHVAFGWQASFYFVAAYSALALLAVLFLLAETNRNPDPGALSPRRYVANVATLMRSRTYVGYVLIVCFMGCGLFAYLSGASFVFQRTFGFPEVYFGYLFAFCMAGNLIGAAISSRLVMRLGIDRLLGLGLGLAAFSATVMAVLAFAGVDHVAIVLGPMLLFMTAFQLVGPQAMAGALSPFPQIAGYASSMIGLMQFGLPALVGYGVAAAFDGTARPMAGAIALTSFLAGGIYLWLVRTGSKGNPA
jgi:MFS transporter, DHA1 family, multidrug resistance protein